MSEYEFTYDWFSKKAIPLWSDLFQQLPPVSKILEIGSFEGVSSVWLLENVLSKTKGKLFCVDTWEGGIEHNAIQMQSIEDRFRRNVQHAAQKIGGSAHIEIIKSRSHDALLNLLSDGHSESFDFIYIDGSHQCADVLLDLSLSFLLCKIGGVIACDDYLWSLENHGEEDLLNQPKLAVDSFVNCFRRKLLPITAPLYQLFLRKTHS